MNSKSKGNIGEIAIAKEFIKFGWSVAFPFGDNERYDLIVDDGKNLKKVQVKYAGAKSQNNAWRCTCCSSTNHTTNKKLSSYKDDVDIIAFYIADLDQCIMFNIDEIKDHKNIYVRKDIPKNNNKNVIYIKDHTFDNYIK